MAWSFVIGTVKGIAIKVHLTFFLIVLWGAFNYGDGESIWGFLYGTVLTLLVFGIVLLHELGHSLAAIRYGIVVRDITLLPIGGVARIEKMPKKPIQEFVVAAAGPAVNLGLGLVALPVLWWLGDGNLFHLFMIPHAQFSFQAMLRLLFLINLSLLVFNLIPAFPLDGGRIFRSLLAMVFDYYQATRLAVWVGQAFSLLLGIYGVFTLNVLTIFVAIFVFFTGKSEGWAVMVKSVLDKIMVRQILTHKGMVLAPATGIVEAASMMMHTRQTSFPVMQDDALLGVVYHNNVQDALKKRSQVSTVAEVMCSVPVMGLDDSLSDVQDKLLETGTPAVVIEDGGIFMGLVDFEDIDRAFQLFRVHRRVIIPG